MTQRCQRGPSLETWWGAYFWPGYVLLRELRSVATDEAALGGKEDRGI